jgi:hypothetical protein
MRYKAQRMANISQNVNTINVARVPLRKVLSACYPQVCTQIENRYLIKI